MPNARACSEADKLYSVIQFEELARAGVSGIGYGLHSEIVAPYILHYGTPEQKAKYLPKIIDLEWVGGWGLTEDKIGSDASNIQTTVSKVPEGYRINGVKR